MPRGRIKPKRGGDKKLDGWREALKEAPGVLDNIARNGAEEILGLVKEGFRKEADPRGKPWAPKQRPDGRKVLSGKTSRLKGGWHVVKASKRGFVVAPSVDYATFHQSGTRRMVARKMVPEGSLPSDWARALNEVAEEILRTHFDSAGDGKGFVVLVGKIGLPNFGSAKSMFVKALKAVDAT